MGIINMIETIKLIHKEDIVLVKVGTFYTAYGKDAYIINYLFNYKLNKTQDVYSSAFPIPSLGKVTAILENNKINYIVVDRRNNYEIDEFCDNKNLNTYTTYFEKARKYINLKIRIENILN